jgi:3-hydroxy-9,10-secoandrosta-1,3,5(10)-triene-9,17-dione monooxygenase
MDEPLTHGATETRTQALARAAALVPTLKDRAARTEQLRQIPGETVRDLTDAGLIRIGNPERYGGVGLDLDAIHEIGWELGRGCGSTAWCYSLWATHNWWLGHFPERVQEEFFATGPDTFFSSGLNPLSGTAAPVDGGFRVSGRWGFSSGCDAATWVLVACGQSREHVRWLMLPRADYEILDTWFSSGLCGSGSKDIVVADAFVPAHRALDPARAGDGDWTGWELHKRLGYRAPLQVLAGWDLASPIIGMAQGAVEEWAAQIRRSSGPGRSAESVALQLRLAEATAEIEAARTLHRADILEIFDRAGRGEPFTPLDRVRYRRDKAFSVKLAVQAVNRIFEAGGARAIMASQPLQRFHRDAHSASHHAGLSWDIAAEEFGRQALSTTP